MKIISVSISIVVLAGFCAAAGAQDSTAVRKDPDAWESRWNSLQPPEAVLDTIGVTPGMRVGEIGAGRGRYVVHVAKRVGADGLVYANDIDSEKLSYLEHRCERDSLTNIVTILGRETNPCFPEGKIDLVYVINSYHHFDKPVELLERTRPALKPEGRLVIVEHDPEKLSHGDHNRSKETVISQVTEAGFELIRISTFLEFDTIYIFRIAK